jgi:hypothetical protein
LLASSRGLPLRLDLDSPEDSGARQVRCVSMTFVSE